MSIDQGRDGMLQTRPPTYPRYPRALQIVLQTLFTFVGESEATSTGVSQMSFEAGEAVIDEIVASCDGDLRGALMALLMVNERLENELQRLYAAVRDGNTLH
ncbi:hypothetical protein Nwi_0985 [Nitrobacter winogradskyi Nb-255]|uniref:Uncharacterized protein n=2 Tax=Nitrobacter winogradskyi TaxID=913 RepID=Q3STZ4_NITWN|nr:hypothetical protein Nwi_0985 [Nitrobacter winogradskyi Nb-255]